MTTCDKKTDTWTAVHMVRVAFDDTLHHIRTGFVTSAEGSSRLCPTLTHQSSAYFPAERLAHIPRTFPGSWLNSWHRSSGEI
jgi:hypothetical protein